MARDRDPNGGTSGRAFGRAQLAEPQGSHPELVCLELLENDRQRRRARDLRELVLQERVRTRRRRRTRRALRGAGALLHVRS